MSKPTNILFFTQFKELEETIPPVPACEFWPKWFKDQKPKREVGDVPWNTVRSCPGIMDIISMGYIIPLWCDYEVVKNRTVDNKEFEISYQIPPNLNAGGKPLFGAATHPHEQIGSYPFRENQWPGSFKFQMPWEVKTDKGYSCLITRPFYHVEPHLEVLTGSVDTDAYHEMHVNSFFEAKPDETVLFKRGMPICQIIPYKREEFQMETAVGDHRTKINRLTQWIHNSVFAPQHYRDKLVRKNYN